MARIIITGCAGLLGSHFSRHLLDRGHDVAGVDDFSGGYRDFVDPRVVLYEGNLSDKKFVDEVFGIERPDYVYHFAAYAAVGLSPFIRSFNYTNNVVASANVVNACINRNVKKIVFTSSMDVYGSAYAPPYTEDLTPVPEDPYGIAKYAVEMDLKQAHRFFGLRYSIVRPHNVFGVYQNIWDKYRNVLGIWIRQTLSGQPLTVYGDGSQVRSFSDIAFYMQPFERLMEEHDGETFNIGADSHTSILSAAQRFTSVAKTHGYDPHIVHLEKRDEVQEAFCDHTKAKNLLDFKDGTDFESLLHQMLTWALSQPQRPVRIMKYEVEKNMYGFWKS
jgi:UDP-glucose 4-epimerase